MFFKKRKAASGGKAKYGGTSLGGKMRFKSPVLFALVLSVIGVGTYLIINTFAATGNLINNGSFESNKSLYTNKESHNERNFLVQNHGEWFLSDYSDSVKAKRIKADSARRGEYVLNIRVLHKKDGYIGAIYVAKPRAGDCTYKLTGEARPISGKGDIVLQYRSTRNLKLLDEGQGIRYSVVTSVDENKKAWQAFEEIMEIKNSDPDHFIDIEISGEPGSNWNWDYFSLTATCKK